MRTLEIDLETYCIEDVTEVGAHRYAQRAEILLFGYAYDDEPVQCIDLASGEEIPQSIIDDIKSDTVRKVAYNAMFERTVLSHFLGMPTGTYLDPKSWYCSMAMGGYLGMPMSLAGISKFLWAQDSDKQKNAAGKRLIKYFSCPCKPTKVNGGRTRNLPEHKPEDWQLYKDYNIQDVVVERNIRKIVEKVGYPESEHDKYVIDQRVNDAGCRVDIPLIKSAIRLDQEYMQDVKAELKERTGLENPNSDMQVKNWLAARGFNALSLNKDAVADILKKESTPPEIREVLELRALTKKTTIKKYYAAYNHACQDGRIRGLFQFYGANRTGRFAGRGVQVQNLSRNAYDEKQLAVLRDSVKMESLDTNLLLHGNLSDNLSQMIRTIFIPSYGNEFIISDYHAIEAVVSAWVCGEKWVLDEFRHDGMLYESTAAQMFHVDKYSIKSLDGIKGANYAMRAKGKVATLACGYGGGAGAFIAMGADKAGMTAEDIDESLHLWRNANPHIVRFWKQFEKDVMKVLRYHKPVYSYCFKIFWEYGFLRIMLPSGRCISYTKAHIREGRFGNEVFGYWGVNQETRQWCEMETWGGKLLENVVQATSRDILCNAMKNLSEAGIRTVMHVHDETINDVPRGKYTVENINELMCTFEDWCKDIPLSSDGYKANFYLKD